MRPTGRILFVLALLALVVGIFYAAVAREYAGAMMLMLFSGALMYIASTLLKAGTEMDDEEPEAMLGPEHAPTPSWWPIVMAAGASVLVISLVISPFLVALGLPLFVVGAAGWFRQTGLPAHGHAAPEHAAEPAVEEAPAPDGPRVLEPSADTLILRLPMRGVVAALALLGAVAAMALFAVLLYSIPKDATPLLSTGVGVAILVATVVVSRRRAVDGAVFRRMAYLTVVPLAVAALSVNMAGLGDNTKSEAAPRSAPAHAAPEPISLSAKGLAFDTKSLAVPAGKSVTVHFANQDSAPHNLAIYRTSKATAVLFQGDLVDPGQSTDYAIPALPAGTFYFRCDVHPDMDGQVVSR